VCVVSSIVQILQRLDLQLSANLFEASLVPTRATLESSEQINSVDNIDSLGWRFIWKNVGQVSQLADELLRSQISVQLVSQCDMKVNQAWYEPHVL
jgi:hypothetical protein